MQTLRNDEEVSIVPASADLSFPSGNQTRLDRIRPAKAGRASAASASRACQFLSVSAAGAGVGEDARRREALERDEEETHNAGKHRVIWRRTEIGPADACVRPVLVTSTSGQSAVRRQTALNTGTPMSLYVGTSGYSYPRVERRVLSPKAAGQADAPLSQWYFRTVEINYTLQRPAIRGHGPGITWAGAVPPISSSFSKACQEKITHVAATPERPATQVLNFLEIAGKLQKRLGPLLFQLPPTFSCHRRKRAAAESSLASSSTS